MKPVGLSIVVLREIKFRTARLDVITAFDSRLRFASMLTKTGRKDGVNMKKGGWSMAT